MQTKTVKQPTSLAPYLASCSRFLVSLSNLQTQITFDNTLEPL